MSDSFTYKGIDVTKFTKADGYEETTFYVNIKERYNGEEVEIGQHMSRNEFFSFLGLSRSLYDSYPLS